LPTTFNDIVATNAAQVGAKKAAHSTIVQLKLCARKGKVNATMMMTMQQQ